MNRFVYEYSNHPYTRSVTNGIADELELLGADEETLSGVLSDIVKKVKKRVKARRAARIATGAAVGLIPGVDTPSKSAPNSGAGSGFSIMEMVKNPAIIGTVGLGIVLLATRKK